MFGNLRNFFENTMTGIIVAALTAFAAAFWLMTMFIWIVRSIAS